MTEDTASSTHPPLPPTTEEERFAWLRLLRSRRVGISTFYRMLGEFGTAKAALAALPEVARAAGVNDYTPCPEGVIAAELNAGRKARARLVAIGEAGYPDLLAQISDAPPLLWMLGTSDVLEKPTIAIVGARNASSLGLRMARKLAVDLGAAGFCVVSGLARGIDTAAHDAALPVGTIAVQAGGVDVAYPKENEALAAKIVENGLRISEQPMGLVPQARHFPPRNRIVSGIAQAVVVIEAASRSGTLITTQSALSQGREVFAVPGHPFDGRAGGCNALIRDGATLIRSAEDVIDALQRTEPQQKLCEPSPVPPIQRQLPLREAAVLHRQILDKLGPSPLAEDQLIRDLASTAKEISPLLVSLELEGQIQRHAGGLVTRVV